jgi:hypothetical protein
MNVIDFASHRTQPFEIDPALLTRLNTVAISAKKQPSLTDLAETELRTEMEGRAEAQSCEVYAMASGDTRPFSPASPALSMRLRALEAVPAPVATLIPTPLMRHPRLRTGVVQPAAPSPRNVALSAALYLAALALVALASHLPQTH